MKLVAIYRRDEPGLSRRSPAFAGDAVLSLPAFKAINPGEDKKLKEACDQAVAGIEAKVAAEKK